MRAVPGGPPRSIVVMGVSGSGKSVVGAAVASRLGYEFIEGDELHPAANVARMASGQPLTDKDRAPWLRAVAARLRAEAGAGHGAVASCSALRRAYRDVLRDAVPSVWFLALTAPADVIAARMARRPHSFMPVSLLGSQIATLEPLDTDERGETIDVAGTLAQTIELAIAAVARSGG